MADASHKKSAHTKSAAKNTYAISEPAKKDGLLYVRFLCADRPAVDLYVKEVLLPGMAGVFSVLRGHTPTLTALIPGPVEVFNSKDDIDFFSVSGGFAVVDKDTVTIMTEAWEHSKEIDIARAKEAQERAEIALKKATDDTDVARAEAALGRAIARIHTYGQISY
jgi:F-type H+-transporting ATPase subunit epsilon